MSGRVVHFEIPFDDAERAMSFYRGLFGWDLQALPGEFGGYVMVTTGPTGEQGPHEPGYINGEMGFAAYFKDPEGNVVGLWENAPQG
jgi:hypothetical protein